ncbi:MAG: FG-GAP repeat protein [Planctomycetes bacterium]|nr:FG-GAP repeat protein [Planctomycetota bacterium]
MTGNDSVAGGADLNGNGIGDLVLYRHSEVNVVRGRALWPPLRGLALEPLFRSSEDMTSEDGTLFGISAALVGDVDGDGFSELLIGATGLFWVDRGNGFLVFGKADWRSEVVEQLVQSGETLQINSVKDKDSLGFSVTAVGDFNGDGVADLALSAQAGSLEFAGESYVIFGGKHLRGAPPLELAELGDRGVRIRGEIGYDEAVDIAPAGDFNGDGRQDLLVSGGNFMTDDNPFPARSFVVFGGTQGMVDLGKLGENGFRIHTGELAQSVGGTDFNGDGFDDVVVRGDAFLYVIFGSVVEAPFIRGDSNNSGDVDLTDAVTILLYLFLGTVELKCKDAADVDDNGSLEITDAIRLRLYLFVGSELPPAIPYPDAGGDPTTDTLSCRG